MRVESHNQFSDAITTSKTSDTKTIKETLTIEKQTKPEEEIVKKDQMQQAVDTVNKLFEINNSQLKFVYHEGLGEYFVQLTNTETEEVVREIPPKKLLDAFYEMQKLAGMIVDEKI